MIVLLPVPSTAPAFCLNLQEKHYRTLDEQLLQGEPVIEGILKKPCKLGSALNRTPPTETTDVEKELSCPTDRPHMQIPTNDA